MHPSNTSHQAAARPASSREVELDRITSLAANVFQVQHCSLVLWADNGHQDQNLAEPARKALHGGHAFFGQLPAIVGHTQAWHFFACAPMHNAVGELIGGICLQDSRAQPDFCENKLAQLQQFAKMAEALLNAGAPSLDIAPSAMQERLQLALESAQMGTWDFNFQTKDRIINHRTAAMLGYETEAFTRIIDSWLDLVHPDDRHKIVEATHIYRKGLSDIISIEYRIRHQAGHDIWVQSYGKLVERDHRGRPIRVVGTLRDITEQKRQQAVQDKQRQLLDLINQAQASFLLNRDIKDACESLFKPLLQISECDFGLIGVVRYTAQGTPYLVVPTMSQSGQASPYPHHSREYVDLDNLFGQVITTGECVLVQDSAQPDLHTVWPEGLPHLNNFIGLPIRFDNEVVGLMGLGNRNQPFDQALLDLMAPLASTLGTLIHARHQEEARVQAEHEWLRLASEDSLTGLPNRRHFFEVAEAALVQAKRYGTPMTIALLDLDNFKQINDTYGHGAGDEVLRVLADILRQALRDSDTPARIGGEEFAVMLTSTPLDDSLTALERIRATLSLTPITIGQRTLHATVSIGAVEWNSEDHDNIHALLLQADAALYRAKRRGRNRVEVHAGGHDTFDVLPDTGFGLMGLA